MNKRERNLDKLQLKFSNENVSNSCTTLWWPQWIDSELCCFRVFCLVESCKDSLIFKRAWIWLIQEESKFTLFFYLESLYWLVIIWEFPNFLFDFMSTRHRRLCIIRLIATSHTDRWLRLTTLYRSSATMMKKSRKSHKFQFHYGMNRTLQSN